MDPEAKDLIDELHAFAVRDTDDWMTDPANAFLPDRKVEDHVCYRAAIWLAAIFEPENQPSQFGTQLVGRQ